MDEKKRNELVLERMQERSRRYPATSKVDPIVIITLKGQDYKLEFNNRSVLGIFKDTGLNILSKGFTPDQMDNPEVIGSMLHRGLETYHPEVTREISDVLFTLRHYPYIIDRISEAVDLIMPDMSDLPPIPPVGEKKESEEDPIQQPIETIG